MNAYNDRSKPITAEDLIRRYSLEKLKSDRKALNTLNDGLTKTNTNLENYVKSTLKSISELQDQVDGNISTWFFNGVPTLDNAPTNEWNTEEEKNSHLGDLYYDQSTGYSYRFALDNNEYKWLKLIDSDITEALALANSALDTADSKRRIFVVEPIPPYDVGDIWLGDETSDLYRCHIARQETDEFHLNDWIKATKYTDDTAANNAVAQLNEFKTQVQDTYVTNATLATSVDSINAAVGSVQRKVDLKSRVFTEVPEPPYYVNDLYIIRDRCYVCIRDSDELYDPEDWQLDLDNTQYSTRSELNILDNSIQALTTSTSNLEQKTTQLNIDLNEIRGEIGDVTDLTVMQEGYGELSFENVNASEPININIHPGENDDIAYLYPADWLFPSDDLYPKDRLLQFENTSTNEIVNYLIPDDLRYYNGVYDEFILDLENRMCKVIHRIGLNYDTGEKYILDSDEIVDFPYPEIALSSGNYVITMLGYPDSYLKVRLMSQNMYTSQFATRVEVGSKVEQAAQRFEVELERKVDTGDYTRASILAKITDNGTSEIDLEADQVGITSNNFKVSKNGNMECNNAKIKGTIESSTIKGSSITNGNNFSVDANGNMNCNNATMNGTINSSNGTIGGWSLNSDGLYKNGIFVKNNGYSNMYTVVDLFVLRAYLQGEPWVSIDQGTPEFSRYDLNGDGVINSLDLLLLRKRVLGIE